MIGKTKYEQKHTLWAKAVREVESIKKSNNYRFCEKCCGNCGHSTKEYDYLRSCDLLPYVKAEDACGGFEGAYVNARMVCDKWIPMTKPH